MLNILRIPDKINIICEQKTADASVRFSQKQRKLEVYLRATKDEVKYVCLRWEERTDIPVSVLGDRWERSYCDLAWLPLDAERFMPWYFLAKTENGVTGCGVAVQPNSFVSFEYDASGVSAWFDVRCGAKGVRLCGRELMIGAIVCEHYEGISSFEAAKRFCRTMCTSPLLPKQPVYGSNNWYYSYGKSSAEKVLKDTDLIVELTAENKNRPYMVIDSCWEKNNQQNQGPWTPNERFSDMHGLVKAMKAKGVRPGIWFRPLYDKEFAENHPNWCNERNKDMADPSHPKTKEYLRETLHRFKEWGFELIKHDFTFVDMFGEYGFKLNGVPTIHKNWAFYDRSKTSAEIAIELYRLILEETPDMVHISCNTASHLCAGLTELNRIGDDTSGISWSRTVNMGVNALAFRLPQHGAFFSIDGDVVALYEKNIPWELNSQWSELLSRCGVPFFASLQPEETEDDKKIFFKEMFRRAAAQIDTAVPLDWEYNKLPSLWNINGKTVFFDWMKDFVPELIEGERRPY